MPKFITLIIICVLLFNTAYSQHWTCLGPYKTPVDIGGAGTYVGVGLVTAIDFSRQDSNKVFLGAANGGVWLYNMKTDSSIPLNFDTAAPFIGVASLVVDPANDKNIYVATGDHLGPLDWGDNLFSTTGIYYTHNGGLSWQQAHFFSSDKTPTVFSRNVFNHHRIPKVIINPANPRTLCCVEHDLSWGDDLKNNSGHIYVSYNMGETWKAINSAFFNDAYFNDIAYDPADTTIIYAASHYLYRSHNGGKTWTDETKKLAGYIPESNKVSRIILSATPAYAPLPILGVLTLSEKDGTRNHLYLVANHLDSSVLPVKSSNINAPEYSLKYKYGLCLSGLEGTLYPFGTLFQVSYNGGKTLSHYSYGQQMHPDLHDVAVSPFKQLSNYVFAGTDGGLYISHDAGKSFKPHFKGFCATMFYSVSVSSNGNRIAGGSQDNGTLRCDNNTTWCRLNGGGDGNNVLFPKTGIDTFLYGDFQGDEVFITHSGGKDYDTRTIPGSHSIPTPLAFLQGHALNFLVGTNDVWKIVKGNSNPIRISNFRQLDSTLYAPGNRVNSIAVWPKDTNTIYAALTGQWADAQGHVSGIGKEVNWNDTAGYSLHQVYATYNGGRNWKDITPVIKGGIGDITSVAVSPKNKKTIWVTHDRWTNNNGNNVNVYMSRNGGKIWEPYYDGLPAVPTYKIICTPGDTLYLATAMGVFYRTTNMEQWQNIAYNLPHTLIRDIWYTTSTHTLYVATWGRSVWQLSIK